METLTQNEKIVWSCWETKTLREVVREAAAKGMHVGLAHRFLQFKQSWDVQTTEAWFNAEVFAWVLQLLSRKQFFKASHVLNKMQIPPHKHMLDVAKESLDNSLRDYIIEQLIKTAGELQKDSPDEWKLLINHWRLLQLLERSFETHGTLKQNRVFGIGKDLSIVTFSEVKMLTIQKIQAFSDEWKRKFASYLFLEVLDFSIVDFLEPEYLWNILLQQNKAMLLKRWIAMYYSKERNATNESLLSDIRLLKVDVQAVDTPEMLKPLDSLFVSWPITSEMIHSVSGSDCYDFTKMCIYDALCAYGHVIDSERDNLNAILLRLSRTQNLGNIDKLFSRSTSTVSRSCLNNMLAKYCIENDEYHTMTTCVDFNLLEKHSESSFSPTHNCLDLWLLFKETANDKETEKYIASIYETCKYVSGNGMDKYFSENPILVLALIIFDGQKSIFEIFNENQALSLQNIKVKWEKPFNHNLPHLFSVFQKWKNNLLVIENDVNVYQLLSGYKGLDISKIFEFQLIENRLKAKRKSDVIPATPMTIERKDATNNFDNYEEMSHFSNRKLVRKYGYQKKLNYIYYLKQNRPCMASQALLVQQYQHFGRLSPKTIKEACTHAHTVALQNWNDLVITASCISFISMIGGDSIKCRTHITCANLIALYLEMTEEKTKDEVIKSVDKLMQQLTMNEKEAHLEILNLSEKASLVKLKNIESNHSQPIDISQILHEWQSVIRFAHFHSLPAPKSPLQILVDENLWIMFLIFGDVFKYPNNALLSMSRGFSSQPLIEHIRHAITYQLVDELHCKDGAKVPKDEHRKTSRGSADMNSTPSEIAEEMDFSLMGDVWEVMASCHGPEDPPGALIRASAALHCPILALLATCYEPDAVDICWAQWVLSSMKTEDLENTSVKQWDPSGMQLSDKRVKRLMEMCLEAGYYKTLYESLIIFYRESPLCTVMKFILQTVLYIDFGKETVELLKSLNLNSGRRESVMGRAERSWLPRLQRPRFIQSTSISLITIALCRGLKTLSHQRSFLQCLCETQFSQNFAVPRPDFCKLAALLNFSMECNIPLDLGNMCGDNAIQFQKEYLENLVSNKMYSKALEFSKLVNLPIEHILIADWTERYNSLDNSSENASQTSNEQSLLLFWTQCSLNFKEAHANPMVTIEYLKKQCDTITDTSQKFYILRLILYWFNKLSEDALAEMYFRKEAIEFEMWMAFLNSDNDNKLQLLSEDAMYDHIIKERFLNPSKEIENTPLVFRKFLDEIEQESNIRNMSISGYKLSIDETERWHRALGRLLECGLVEEAWRLSKMFSAPPGYSSRPLCSIELVETCLRLAEGIINPYELPQSLRSIVALSSGRLRLSDSQCSDNSFEELVMIPDKQDDSLDAFHIAGRREADSLSSLEALASKSGLKIVKQIASIYRMSLQIGWSYTKVLKYDGNPLDLINNLSGRSRMPLAKIIFSTYEIPTQKIVEYLCLEIVGAVISPHLTRTSGFRQKEHFRYTLWGYPLDSDFEMFLNLRPDDNSTLGRMILEHLTAFRKLYKTDGNVTMFSNTDYTEIEDVEVIIDEEYQNIDDYEVQSVISQTSASTIGNSPYNVERLSSVETQSVVSDSTVCSRARYTSREKKPQFDVISCTNIRIKSSVKINMKSLLKGAKLSSKQVNVISIEMLVLAHECFSSVCDTEGTATVLRSAQTLTAHLLAARSWRLMVRLLTGLGRYTEMAYIFQMLRDNHQFEFLLGQFDYILGQHQEKIISFKQGLLEFLKRHCPGDTETYCLVALHFSMYSEAADVKKKQANDLIVTLIQMALDSTMVLKKRFTKQPEWIILTNSDSNRLLLDTAINHCCDSAELYSKAGCLGAAREMAGLAQLLALQISLLSSPPTKCILNLSQDKMATIVDSYLSFMEGLVFAHAVDGGGGGWMSRWRELVYQRMLKSGDLTFIKDIATLRPDIACYIIERYEGGKNLLNEGAEAILELRSYFKQPL